MFGVFFCWVKLIKDVFENMLMLVFFVVIVVNLGIGVVSRILVENVLNIVDKYKDVIVMKIFIFGVNILVIGLIIGK